MHCSNSSSATHHALSSAAFSNEIPLYNAVMISASLMQNLALGEISTAPEKKRPTFQLAGLAFAPVTEASQATRTITPPYDRTVFPDRCVLATEAANLQAQWPCNSLRLRIHSVRSQLRERNMQRDPHAARTKICQARGSL